MSEEPRRAEFPPWITDRAASIDPADPESAADELAAERQDLWCRICPKKFHEATLATLERSAENATVLHMWAEMAVAGGAPNLVLAGDVGRGKTFAALAVGRAAFFAGHSVIFAPVVELLEALRPDGTGSVERFLRCGLLILDDLGGERPTDWTAERLYLIINRRWLDARPIVATTNLKPDHLREALGARCYDRLRDGAIARSFDGESSRRRPRPACENGGPTSGAEEPT